MCIKGDICVAGGHSLDFIAVFLLLTRLENVVVSGEWLIVCSEIINEDEDAAGNNKNSPLNTKYSDLLSSTTLRQNDRNKVKVYSWSSRTNSISVLNTILKCSLVVVSKSIRTLGTCLHWSIFVCVSYSSWQDRSSEKESGAVSGAGLLLCHAIF